MRAVTKVSDRLVVIRFQCPTLAWKEGAEFPIFPFSVPSLKLDCLSWDWVSKSETEVWVVWSWRFIMKKMAFLSDLISRRVMRLDTVGMRQGAEMLGFLKVGDTQQSR